MQLSMQISQNIHTTMELRSDLNDVEDQMRQIVQKLENLQKMYWLNWTVMMIHQLVFRVIIHIRMV